jgi:hypothetical protein
MQQSLANGFDDAFEVSDYIFVHEPHDLVTLQRQPRVAAFVAFVVDVVRSAVHFHNEFAFEAGEVGDVWADRVLAAELEPIQRAVAQG